MRRLSLLPSLLPVLLLLLLHHPLFTTAAGPYPLADGIIEPVLTSINDSTYLTFSVSSHSPFYELRVTLTVSSGNPDLFIATQPNPQLNNATWRSYDAGHSALIIRSSDHYACPAPCTYYITVRDYYNPSSSNILVTERANYSTIALNPLYHAPTTGILDPSTDGLAWYAFNTSHPLDLRLILTPIQGDAELIISPSLPFLQSHYWAVHSGQITGPLFTLGSNSLWTTNGHGLDTAVLRVPSTDPNFCPSPCQWHAIVYPKYDVIVEYTLQLGYVWGGVDPVWHRLVNHVPLVRVLQAGEQESFVMSSPPQTNSGLTLSISRTKVVGLSTMFVSRGSCTNTTQTSEWSSSGLYTHSSVFNTLSMFPIASNTTWCATIVAETNTTLTITGSLTLLSFPDRSPLRLINGLPYNDALRDNRWRYYVHYQPFNDSATLSVSRKFGDFRAVLCRQNFTIPTPVVPARDCTPLLNGDGLAALTGYLPAGRYLVGVQAVRGYSFDVDYTVTLAAGYTNQRLQTAVPLPSIIEPEFYLPDNVVFNTTYYEVYWPFDMSALPVEQRRNFTITCTLYSGHATLYASTLTYPTSSSYQWKSGRERMDTITIPWSQLRPGYIYLTVDAATASTFSPQASTYSDVQLQPGLPSNSYLSKGEMHLYWLTLPQFLATNVTVALVPIRGFASLFLSNNSLSTTRDPVPGDRSSYSVHVNNSLVAMQLEMIPHLDWCRGASGSLENTARCRYTIGVYGEEATRYQLTVITPSSTQILQAGIPQPGFIGAIYRGGGQQYERPSPRYQFYVPSNLCNVTLSLTTLIDIDLYNTTGGAPLTLFISRREVNTTSNPLFRFIVPHQATIYFDYRNAAFDLFSDGMQGFYYAEIVGSFGAVFTLGLTINDELLAEKQGWPRRVTNSSALIVLDGQPQRYSLEGGRFALFQYDVPVTRHSEFVQLTAESLEGGGVEIYVRGDGQLPVRNRLDPNQWWSGASGQISDVIIPAPRAGMKGYCDQSTGQCSYLAAVYLSPGSTFSSFVFSVTDDGPRDFLLDSVPTTVEVAPGPGAWRYFQFVVPPVPRNLALDVTMDLGENFNNGAVLFAELGRLPTMESTRGASIDGRNAKLRVENAQPGLWIVGVFNGNSFPSSVTVVATTDDTIRLLDAVPFYYSLSVNQRTVTFRYDLYSPTSQPFLFHLQPEVGNPYLSFYANFDGLG